MNDSHSHLRLGGCDAVSLASEFGTPLYVIDETDVRSRCRGYRQAFEAVHPDTVIAYSAKAFFSADIGRICREEGLWLDVNSGGELYAALASGFNPAHVIFHGNNKTAPEIAFALDARIGRFAADNGLEVDLIAELAAQRGVRASILIRTAPGVSADTHEYIKTGQADSKFGFPIEGGSAEAAAVRIAGNPRLRLAGLHAHVGSQLLTADAVCLGARRLVGLAARVNRLGIKIAEIDIGGGLGVNYNGEQPVAMAEFASAAVSALREETERSGLAMRRLIVEPGRSIIAEAGTALYRIGAVKHSPNGKRYVSVDGGMADNPRPALYGATYRAALAHRTNGVPTGTYDVVGRFCESGDVLVRDCPLPDPRPGDILAVFTAGAYQMSMSSNYNMVPRPAVVLVGDGRARLSVRRETYADLCSRDVLPLAATCVGLAASP